MAELRVLQLNGVYESGSDKQRYAVSLCRSDDLPSSSFSFSPVQLAPGGGLFYQHSIPAVTERTGVD